MTTFHIVVLAASGASAFLVLAFLALWFYSDYAKNEALANFCAWAWLVALVLFCLLVFLVGLHENFVNR